MSLTPAAAPPGPQEEHKTRRRRRWGITLAVVTVVAAAIPAVGRGVLLFERGLGPPTPRPASTAAPATTAPAQQLPFLSEAESQLVQVTRWEVVHTGQSSHFLVYVEAPGLERESTLLQVAVRAQDATGTVHQANDFVRLHRGGQALALGYFPEPFTAEVVALDATFSGTSTTTGPDPYTASLDDVTVDHSTPRPWVRGTLSSGRYGEAPSTVRVAAVARDDDGQVVNLGVGHFAAPALGESTPAGFPLWGQQAVPDDVTWELWYSTS